MSRILIALLAITLAGCVTTDLKMYQLQGAGKPQQAVDLFYQQYPSLEKSDANTLLPLCTSLQMMHRFGDFDHCLTAYHQKEDYDLGSALVETYRAGMYFHLGNYQKARQQALQAIEDDKDPLPLGPYEYLARVAARQGDTEEALAWTQKLDELKATVFGISIAEDSLAEVKRDQKARIYIDLKRPELAEKELRKPLPGKSLGEYIFMGVIDYLETDVDRVASKLTEWAAPEDTENWRFMMEVQTLWTYGQVAHANGNHRDAIQSFRRMLNLPNIEQLRIFYVEGLFFLAKAYRDYGDNDKSSEYAALLEQAIARDAPNIPWPTERESFKAKYQL